MELEALEDRRVLSQVTNPISHFDISVNGQFDGPEWSDVTPLAFIRLPDGTLRATQNGDPLANSFLYFALDPGVDKAYLGYDQPGSGNVAPTPGSQIADITFPVDLNGVKHLIDVQVRGGLNSFFDVFVEIDGQPSTVPTGLEAAAANGPSPNSPAPHLIVEAAFPLNIPQNFGPAFPAAGVNPGTGLYDPSPQFWTGSFPPPQGQPPQPHTLQPGDPLGTSALFQINPDGSTTANSDVIVTQVVIVRSPHSVNLESNGLLPLQILSTPTFDATTIDPTTVAINGKTVAPRNVVVADVNGDGIPDLILNYHVRDLVNAGALNESSTDVVLTGDAPGGVVVGGSAKLLLVPPGPPGGAATSGPGNKEPGLRIPDMSSGYGLLSGLYLSPSVWDQGSEKPAKEPVRALLGVGADAAPPHAALTQPLLGVQEARVHHAQQGELLGALHVDLGD